MRRLKRRDLSASAQALLDRRTRKVRDAANPREEADRLWQSKRGKSWDEIREVLRTMASGVERCMYCEDSAGTDIDHFYPKSQYPNYAYDWTNYLLACSHCNSEKRDDFPIADDGWPLLIDPTSDDPADYLEFAPMTGLWVGIDEWGAGETSIRVFGLKREMLTKGRRNAWSVFQMAIKEYERLRGTSRNPEADNLLALLRELPFSSVFTALIRLATNPDARSFFSRGIPEIIERRPELTTLFESLE